MPQEISAGTIIFRRNQSTKQEVLCSAEHINMCSGKKIKFLVIQYGTKEKPKHWDFPRGGIEKWEDEKETVIREIKEETGIEDLIFVPNFREVITWFYKREGKTIFKKAIFYLAETKEEKVKLSSEHVNYDWLEYEKALEKLTFKNAKELLQKANQFLTNYYKLNQIISNSK